MNFFIVPDGVVASTNWSAGRYLSVGPRKIWQGTHAGSYAVNTAIFDSDPAFEQFRAQLETLPTAEVTAEEFKDPNARREHEA